MCAGFRAFVTSHPRECQKKPNCPPAVAVVFVCLGLLCGCAVHPLHRQAIESSPPGSWSVFDRKIAAFEERIAQAGQIGKQLRILGELKSYLRSAVADMERRPEDLDLAVYFKLVSLDEFLSVIPDEFTRDQCGAVRAYLVFSYSPHDDHPTAEATPEEAARVGRMLNHICGDSK
jgi:hypothetical protein